MTDGLVALLVGNPGLRTAAAVIETAGHRRQVVPLARDASGLDRPVSVTAAAFST